MMQIGMARIALLLWYTVKLTSNPFAMGFKALANNRLRSAASASSRPLIVSGTLALHLQQGRSATYNQSLKDAEAADLSRSPASVLMLSCHTVCCDLVVNVVSMA